MRSHSCPLSPLLEPRSLTSRHLDQSTVIILRAPAPTFRLPGVFSGITALDFIPFCGLESGASPRRQFASQLSCAHLNGPYCGFPRYAGAFINNGTPHNFLCVFYPLQILPSLIVVGIPQKPGTFTVDSDNPALVNWMYVSLARF